MAPLQSLLWACLLGIISFCVHHELRQITVKLSEEIFIHAKRSDVYPALKDLKLLVDIHPLATGLSNVVTRITEDGYEETYFVLHIKYSNKLGLSDMLLDTSGVLREIQPGVKVGLTGQLSDILNMNLTWSLIDYKDGDKDGLLLVGKVEYTGMRCLVNFVLVEAVAVHRVILRKLKEHVEREHPEPQQGTKPGRLDRDPASGRFS